MITSPYGKEIVQLLYSAINSTDNHKYRAYQQVGDDIPPTYDLLLYLNPIFR